MCLQFTHSHTYLLTHLINHYCGVLMQNNTGIKIIELDASSDTAGWNAFVSGHKDGNVFQTFEMYQVYARTRKYEPLCLAAVSPEGDILALVQAVIIKELGGPASILSARAVIHGGPLWAPDSQGKAAVIQLMQHYDSLVRSRVLYTQIRNMTDMSLLAPQLKELGYDYEEHLNILVDLTKEEDKLWSDMSKSRRRGVKGARKNNLEIEEVTSRQQVDIFYSFLKGTYQRIELPLVDVSIFHAVYDIMVPAGLGRFLLVKKDGEYIAGRAILMFEKEVYAWYRAADPGSSRFYPNDLMGWDIIERYHREGYHRLDQGGAGKPDEDYGVRDFKKQFGGNLVNFGRFRKDHHPLVIRFSMAMLKPYSMLKRLKSKVGK